MSDSASPRFEAPRFATTKIQPARPRARRIARPALDAALLAAALTRRVVLLQAPAGYGKTTALASLAAALPAGHALAWVALDAGDDAARLFACLAAALEPYDLPWRTLPQALVPHVSAGPDGARRALAELVNAMAHADVAHGMLVLEDLHRVTDGTLFAFVEQLLERLPAHWTLVLSSRELPPLALARWRAADELVELGAEALAFSDEETRALIAAEELPVPAAPAAALLERNRGWPAGLRLTLAALKARPGLSAGVLSDRYLFDYLASEVLESLPAPLHDFLLRCSILPELVAPLAAAVSGDWRAADRLDEIERRGLFATALDTAERTLVLHDLFREALEARLAQRLPGELDALLHRAAASEPDPVRRIGYLQRARDWAGAEQALDAAAPELFVNGGVGDVQRLLAQFDAGWRASSARLERLAGTIAFQRWDWVAMERHFAAAAGHATAAGQHDERLRAQAMLPMALYALDRNAESERLIETLRGEDLPPHTRRVLLIADATQHFRRGRLDALPGLYRQVVESLQRGASLYEWWESVPAPNWSTLPGMRCWLERYVDGALARIGTRPLPMRGEAIAQRAFLRLWAGRMDEAREDIRQAEDDLRWFACSGEMEITVQLFRMIECAICGRADELAAHLAQQVTRDADAPPERRRLWLHQVAIYGVRMNHTLGAAPEAIEHWATFLKEDPLRSSEHRNPRSIEVRARHAAAQGRWRAAAEGLQGLLPKLAEMDVMARHVELRLRCAEAWLHCGEPALAAQAAAPALERIARDGDIGHAWMAGPAALRTLAEGDWNGELDGELQQVVQDAARSAAALRGAAAEPAAPTRATAAASQRESPAGAFAATGLTARETEVLELIAAGQPNKLIARALDISPHTVKRHVANVLDKIGVESRGQAAAWYRQQA